jgi:lysophospholipase L1-like esterase
MWYRNLLFSIGAAICLLFFLEGMVRVLGIVNIQQTRGWGHSYECCGDLRANQKILSLIEEDHPYVVRVNNRGLRNIQDISIKNTSDLRILAIGDSFTFGPYVSNNETWPARLEQFLQESFVGKKIEVLNAGISSYTISDELDFLKEKGLSLEPDMVVLDVTHNDLSDLRNTQRIYFKRQSVQAPFREKRINSIKNFLLDHSYFVSLLISQKQHALNKSIDTQQINSMNAEAINAIKYGTNNEYEKPYETYLSEFARVLAEKNIPLVVLYYPEADMLFEQKEEGKKPNKTADFIKMLGIRYGFPVLDATEWLKGTDVYSSYLLPWNGHPSSLGYYLVGKEIRNFLINSNMIILK